MERLKKFFSRTSSSRRGLLLSTRSNVGSGSTGGDSINAWFTDPNGSCCLNVSLPPADPSAPGTTSSNPAPVLNLKLSELCTFIDQLEDLQKAQVFSTESYSQPIGLFTRIKHRFLILEIQRLQDPRGACLRLDRRRGENTSLLRASAPLVQNEANDRAMFTIRKCHVVQRGVRENRQTFARQPTMRELRVVLQLVCEGLGGYRTWPSNCWAFCSVIQQILESVYGGSFERGGVRHPGIGPELQRRIYRDIIQVICAPDSLLSSSQRPFRAEDPLVHTTKTPHASLPPETHSGSPAIDAIAAQPSAIMDGSELDVIRRGLSVLHPYPELYLGLPSNSIPSVTLVNPNTSPVGGGISVAVLGSHFPSSLRCFFGSEESTITKRGEGWLYCILPQARTPGPVTVTIRVDDSTTEHRKKSGILHFLYLPADKYTPSVTGVASQPSKQ